MVRSLDSIDEQLIRLVQRDGRQSSEKLAKSLNVSATTVRRRLRELIRSNVLRIAALADVEKAGFPMVTLIALDVEHGKLEQSADLLASHTRVPWVSVTTGRFGVVGLGVFRSANELSNFLQKEIPEIEGLRNCETLVCLDVKKGRYMLI